MSTKQAGAAANDLLRTIICHRTTLVSVANRILHCRHLAEDVVQDAALKACQMADGPPLDCPLRFSCSVVRNLAIDRARRCALERRHAAPLLQAEELAAPLETPERTLEGREALRLVLQALDDLPERTRLAFELHRFHDVPQKDIAIALGVSPTLVNFMIRRTQEHCRARLDEQETPVQKGQPAQLQPERKPQRPASRAKRTPPQAAALHSLKNGLGALSASVQAAASRYPSGSAHRLS